MYQFFIKIMYEQDFRKFDIDDLEEIKDILERFKGQVLETRLKHVKEENGISYKKERKNNDNKNK